MVGNSKTPFPNRLAATVGGSLPPCAFKPEVIVPLDMSRQVDAPQLKRGFAFNEVLGLVSSKAPAQRNEGAVDVRAGSLVDAQGGVNCGKLPQNRDVSKAVAFVTQGGTEDASRTVVGVPPSETELKQLTKGPQLDLERRSATGFAVFVRHGFMSSI